MNRRLRPHARFLPLILAATLGLALLPHPALAAALANRASIALETTYLLKAALSYKAGTISVSERISIKNVSGGPISKLNLSVMPRAFGELLSIGSYRVDGKPASAAWSNNSNLVLQLGRNVADGASAVVALTFKVRASSTVATSLEGRLSRTNGIMQVSHWFPIVSDGHATRYPGDSQYTRTADKIRLELSTDSSAIKVAAPGVLKSSSDRHFVYEMLDTRDFAFGASPYYRVMTGTAAGVGIKVYYTSGNAAAALTSASQALVRYESVFGQYQWPRFVIAQTGRTGSGNEYPGIIFLGGPLFSDREVVAHETAHQWWYAMAGNDQLREPWLDEGIAEFSAAYFFSGFRPYTSTRPVNSPITDFPNQPASWTPDEPNSYDQTIYFKSARFLDGLRVRMGTAKFFGGMRTLFKANRNGVVTTREFYDTMVQIGAPPSYLDQFIRL